MSTQQIQSLNKDIASPRESLQFPYVEVMNPSDCIALVLPNIEVGDLPVLCTFEGKRRQIGKILKSAKTLSTLLSITKLRYHKDIHTFVDLQNNVDCLEVLM